jgi:hypothetical protein
VSETIEARITKVERQVDRSGQPTDWFVIDTDHERYKQLKTKIQEKAVEAMRLSETGGVSLIDFTQQEGRARQDGSRWPPTFYYERAAAKPVEQTEIPMGSPPPESEFNRKMNPTDAWRICLSAGAKLAVATLPLLPNDQRTPEIQQQIALWWGKFLYYTPSPSPGSFDAPNPQPDDDIPFDHERDRA